MVRWLELGGWHARELEHATHSPLAAAAVLQQLCTYSKRTALQAAPTVCPLTSAAARCVRAPPCPR